MKTASNTSMALAAPSEPIDRLVSVLERCAVALERIASQGEVPEDPPVRDTRGVSSALFKPATARHHVRDDETTTRDLFTCKVCGLSEGELTTECPGEKPPKGFAERVYKAELDFVGGEWRPSSMLAKLASTADRYSRDGNARAMPIPHLPEAAATGAAHKPAGVGPEPAKGNPAPKPLTTPTPAAAPQTLVASHLAAQLEAQIKLGERIVAVLGRDLGGRVAILGDETRDVALAMAVKQHAVNLLTEPEFDRARATLGVKPGECPDGATLRRFALEIVEPELLRREQAARAPRTPMAVGANS